MLFSLTYAGGLIDGEVRSGYDNQPPLAVVTIDVDLPLRPPERRPDPPPGPAPNSHPPPTFIPTPLP
ncbi:hypothetical protein MLD38_001009 [Melastoma candidum]|uniref:Uncharacterized protein n=1 Tax=Melastoma candidum TaxID=119954 RepID=A0ACB9SCB7_9MYRT|nr:hypothetical protein MLD38_001009 [Melastoma candidum]